ncbi:hypothetical protein Acr_01g0014740 [Actinidia rufa]|uniref:Uncharacterized protein n=1 Tax=Actinidia rufa TaxID=165716 RepID=A0A7J0E659_9ERIC|nr:hypothetical protein Acr_01g0014740 [Actinidia rufa]
MVSERGLPGMGRVRVPSLHVVGKPGYLQLLLQAQVLDIVLDLGLSLISSPSKPTSPLFGIIFLSPTFFSARLRNQATAGYGTDRGTPVRGHAVLRVVMKLPSCP